MGMDILEEKYEFLKWNWLLSFLRGSAEGAVTTATRESPFVAKTAVRDTPFLGGKGRGGEEKKVRADLAALSGMGRSACSSGSISQAKRVANPGVVAPPSGGHGAAHTDQGRILQCAQQGQGDARGQYQ